MIAPFSVMLLKVTWPHRSKCWSIECRVSNSWICYYFTVITKQRHRMVGPFMYYLTTDIFVKVWNAAPLLLLLPSASEGREAEEGGIRRRYR